MMSVPLQGYTLGKLRAALLILHRIDSGGQMQKLDYAPRIVVCSEPIVLVCAVCRKPVVISHPHHYKGEIGHAHGCEIRRFMDSGDANDQLNRGIVERKHSCGEAGSWRLPTRV